MLFVRPLGSTGVTPLPGYYGPHRLPADAASRLCIPARRWSRCRALTAGSPRFLNESFPARCPQPPRKARQRSCSRYSFAGGRLHHLRQAGRPSLCVTRPNRIQLLYGSQVRFARLRLTGSLRCSLARLHAERVIHMVDSFHSTRFASFTGTPKTRRRQEDRRTEFRYKGLAL
jgi:hypothetical protein